MLKGVIKRKIGRFMRLIMGGGGAAPRIKCVSHGVLRILIKKVPGRQIILPMSKTC